MTVLELCKAVYRIMGVIAAGETPDTGQNSDFKEALNLLLGEWENMGLLSLSEEQQFTAATGTASYSIGSGETWDGNKPVKINAAACRIGGIDYPIEIINEDSYLNISDKSSTGIPNKLYYRPSGSTGTIYLSPAPAAAYTIIITNNKAFTTYSSDGTEIDLPAGYLSALKYNVAVELYPEFEMEPKQWVVSRAFSTLEAIKNTNSKRPPTMLTDTQGGVYDIDTGTYRSR